MGPERRTAASSDESSSSSSAAADRMELEVAEALAGMAHSAGRGGGGKWGGKGKRAKSKRVKSESPTDDPSVDSVPDPPPDRGVAAGDQGGPTGCTDVLLDLAKVEPEPEPEPELPKLCTSCTRSPHGVGAGRCRQNLTEEEKEARRLRRVLANRESARQTIRRRQAVCEELTQKATDLAWENENLKREKGLVLNEYHSLEVLNKRLKAQALKVEMEEARELKLVSDDKFNTQRTSGHTLVKDRQPFSPVCWPSVVQFANVQSQNGPQNAVLIPSNIPIPPNGKIESSWQQQENAFQVNGPRAPLYLVPCPWFFPVPEHGSEFLPQPAVRMNPVGNLCEDVVPSNGAAATENLFSLQVKLDDASPEEVRLMTDLNEAPIGCLPEEESDEWLSTSLAISSVSPATPIKHEISSQSEHNPVKDNPIRASQIANDFAHRDLHQCNFQRKQLVDAAAAAQARRKRKELTKLKNLHGRQCKTSC